MRYLLIILSLLFFSFSVGSREEIISRYQNGSKKLLVKYIGSGSSEEIIQRIYYKENGDTLSLENYNKNGIKHGQWIFSNGNIKYYNNGSKLFSYENEFNQQFDLLIKYRNSFEKDTLVFDLDYAFNIFELYKSENPDDSEVYVALGEALFMKRPNPLLNGYTSPIFNNLLNQRNDLINIQNTYYNKIMDTNTEEETINLMNEYELIGPKLDSIRLKIKSYIEKNPKQFDDIFEETDYALQLEIASTYSKALELNPFYNGRIALIYPSEKIAAELGVLAIEYYYNNNIDSMNFIYDKIEKMGGIRVGNINYAYNLLNSCEPHGILFTNGDNDTFPLLYLQNYKNIRSDVKVINLSLLNIPAYIKKNHQTNPQLLLSDELLENIDLCNGDSNHLLELVKKKWLNDNYPNMKIKTPNGTKFNWEFKNGQYGLGLTNITIMNIIEKNFDDRPIYFSVTTGNNQLGLDDYLLQEGLVYKLTNQINMSARPINMNINRTLDLIDNIYKMDNPIFNHGYILNILNQFYSNDDVLKIKYHYLYFNARIAAIYRNVFDEVVNHMVVSIKSENNIETSFAIRELLNEYIPNTIVPEMKGMAVYRTWEYYDSIIRYCMFMKEYNNGVPVKDMIFIEQNMPDLYEYLATQFPELIQ